MRHLLHCYNWIVCGSVLLQSCAEPAPRARLDLEQQVGQEDSLPDSSASAPKTIPTAFTVNPSTRNNVLFVVDNSSSMFSLIGKARASFFVFAEAYEKLLRASAAARPDPHAYYQGDAAGKLILVSKDKDSNYGWGISGITLPESLVDASTLAEGEEPPQHKHEQINLGANNTNALAMVLAAFCAEKTSQGEVCGSSSFTELSDYAKTKLKFEEQNIEVEDYVSVSSMGNQYSLRDRFPPGSEVNVVFITDDDIEGVTEEHYESASLSHNLVFHAVTHQVGDTCFQEKHPERRGFSRYPIRIPNLVTETGGGLYSICAEDPKSNMTQLLNDVLSIKLPKKPLEEIHKIEVNGALLQSSQYEVRGNFIYVKYGTITERSEVEIKYK